MTMALPWMITNMYQEHLAVWYELIQTNNGSGYHVTYQL